MFIDPTMTTPDRGPTAEARPGPVDGTASSEAGGREAERFAAEA